MSVYRDILRQSSIYSITVLATRGIGFLALPIYTRYLTPADYGILELIDTVSSLIGAILGLRLGDALLYYYNQARTQEERERTVTTVLAGATATALLAIGLGWMISPQISRLVFGSEQYANLFRLMFPSLGFSIPLEAGLTYFRAIEKPAGYVAISSFRVFISFAVNIILLVGFGLGVWGMLWGNISGTLAASAIVAIYLGSRLPLRLDRKLLRRLLRYSAPLCVSSVSLLIFHSGDRFFLQRSVSLTDIGIYALAYKIAMLIAYVQMPFGMFWNVRMFRVAAQEDADTVIPRTCTYLALVLTGVALALAMFASPFVKIMAGPEFQSCVQYIPLLLAAYVIRAVGDQFRNVFFLHNKTPYDAWVTGGSLVVCLTCYATMIPRWKSWGAVVATVITFTAAGVLAYFQARRVHVYPFEIGRLLQLFATAAGIMAIFYFLRPESIWGQSALGLILLGLYPAVLSITGFFHHEEHAAIRAATIRIRQRAFSSAI